MAILFWPKKSKIKTITKTDTVYSVKTINKYIKGKNIAYKVLDTVIKHKYDTAFIVKEFNTVKEYTDTIKKDGHLFIINDTISHNQIIARSFQAQIKERTITNIIENKPKSALYLGIRSDMSHDMLKINHNVNLTFKTRKKGLYSIGYGMSGYSIGYSFKF